MGVSHSNILTEKMSSASDGFTSSDDAEQIPKKKVGELTRTGSGRFITCFEPGVLSGKIQDGTQTDLTHLEVEELETEHEELERLNDELSDKVKQLLEDEGTCLLDLWTKLNMRSSSR